MNSITFTVSGPPRTKKNSGRIVRIGNFHKLLPSKQYTAWFRVAMQQSPGIRTILRDAGVPIPLRGRVHVAAIFYRQADTGDINNYQAALADWLQAPKTSKRNPAKLTRNGAGIIDDDKQIVSWDGSRLEVDRANPRIVVTIEALEAEQEGLFQNRAPLLPDVKHSSYPMFQREPSK